ncbi:MAG: hypothetical protein ACK5B9_10455 [Flavobacteriia bacterium]|jgi:hypothetical protein
MQNESNDINDFLSEKMRESFSAWNPSFDHETNWRELSKSIDTEISLNQLKNDIAKSEIEVPEAIWFNLNNSLEKDFVDEKLKLDYTHWNPSPTESTFEEIQESIQLEKVWSKLNQSLNQEEIKQTISISKVLILISILFISYFTNDHFFLNKKNKIQLVNKQGIPTILKVNNQKENTEVNNVPQSNPKQIAFTRSQEENNFLAIKEAIKINDSKNHIHNALETENNQAQILNPIKTLPVFQNPIFNIEEKAILNLSENNPRNKGNIGINYFTTINLIQNNSIKNLTTNVAGLGYEFGLFFRHKIKNLTQEYCVNYNLFNQTENTFDNGTFTRSKYTISGIKINTFTAIPLLSKFNLGGGLSTFLPIQAIKERENTIVDLPKINAVNFGLNVGLDYNLGILKANKIKFCFKYETIFSLNNTTSNFKLFQNYNLGLKYNF